MTKVAKNNRKDLGGNSAPVSSDHLKLISPTDQAPDPEVSDRPVRRKFTAEYKLRILREAEQCPPGQVGALLRREGLYSSHLTDWRRQREEAEREALAPQKRGRKAKDVNPLAHRVTELERENERLKQRLAKAEIIIDVQKKISSLLGISSNPPESDKDN
jgi:transposase